MGDIAWKACNDINVQILFGTCKTTGTGRVCTGKHIQFVQLRRIHKS